MLNFLRRRQTPRQRLDMLVRKAASKYPPQWRIRTEIGKAKILVHLGVMRGTVDEIVLNKIPEDGEAELIEEIVEHMVNQVVEDISKPIEELKSKKE